MSDGNIDEIKKKRGRPKKVPVESNKKIVSDSSSEILTMENSMPETKSLGVKDVIDAYSGLKSMVDIFSGNGSNAFTTISNMNLYNPFLQNNRLKMISAYPSTYKPDEISKALKEPQNHELMLQSASSALSASQYLYYKILREASDVPMYKHYFIPEPLEEKEYDSKKFKDEEEFVEGWAESFHLVQTLKKMGMEVKREGKSTYLFRQCISEDGGKKKAKYVVFQKLPQPFVKLTGLGEHGYIASFNLLIFLQPAFSPKQYPEYIRKIWEDLISNNVVSFNIEKKKYDVNLDLLYKYEYKESGSGSKIKGTLEIASSIRKAADNAYMYWVQLPQDLCFTFASDMSTPWAVPDTIGLFTSLQELTDYSTLAGLISSTPLTAVLTGEAEFVDGARPGQDETKIAAYSLESFQNAFNEMVSSNINSFFAPLKNLKLQSLPNIPYSSDIKTKAIQNFIGVAGEGGLITSSDKPSIASIKGAQLAAESQYDFVTRQFEDVLNFVLNEYCDCYYRWTLKLWGGIYTIENQTKNMKELVAAGATFLLPKLASAYDLNMRDVRSLTDYVSSSKIYDKFKTLAWKQTQQNREAASKDSTQTGAGRKAISDSDIENDSTAQSKETGENVSELKQDYEDRQKICPLCGSEDVEDGHIFCSNCESEYGLEEEV